ncbi:MAG: hypothetical protein ACI9XU_000184 [Arenicella sp.]|jgi:hypothetical protein
MNISVEISLYPLQDGYLNIIDLFLLDINQNSNQLEIRTSNMSTRIFGDFDSVTQLLNSAMRRSMQLHGKIVFVCKYLEGDARHLEAYN